MIWLKNWSRRSWYRTGRNSNATSLMWKYSRSNFISLNFFKLCSLFRSSPLCQVQPGRAREGTGVSYRALIGVSEFAMADEPCGTLLACPDELRSLTCAFPPSIGGCLGIASQKQCSGLQIEKEIYRKEKARQQSWQAYYRTRMRTWTAEHVSAITTLRYYNNHND